MTSEVRKVLNSCVISSKVHDRLDAAERADAARREEPVQALRQKVAELVAEWKACSMPPLAASFVKELLADLNAILATKPDHVENRQAAASGPVMHESVWRGPYNVPPNGEIQLDEHIRAIAAAVVRDAMPDVLDGLAKTFREKGLVATEIAFCEHAEKLRKERGA